MTAMPLPDTWTFTSRRSGSPGGHVATGPQAPVDTGAAGGVTASPADFAPFTAYVLCHRPSRKGRAPIPISGTMARLRGDVRDAFVSHYANRAHGQREWAKRIKEGAFIARLVVTLDPAFKPPRRGLA